jgi:predicted glycoside hydrolase/deacetylase ChbG (UPF0249 family)
MKNNNTGNENKAIYKQMKLPSNNNKIIINADDLGICKERDEGIFELFEQGFISSATALVNFPNSQNSIQKARLSKRPIGLHVNLTEGSPVYQTNLENNSLVYYNEEFQSYQFYGKFLFRLKIKENQISSFDLKNEITHQVIIL